MATPDSAAVLRGDLATLVEEAAMAEKFYIGSRVMPMLGVDTKDGQYPVFKKAKGELLNDDATRRRPGGSYGRVDREYENDNYSCIDRGLEEPVDDTYAKDVGRFFDAEAKSSDFVRRQVALGLEVRVAAKIIDTGVFSVQTHAVDYTQALIATIDFPTDVLATIDALNGRGEMPNTIVISSQVFNRVKRSTLLQNFVRGNRPSDSTLNMTPSAVASAFAENGITTVLVGAAVKNSAKKGQAFSASRIWPNTHFWIGRVESGAYQNMGVGRTLTWNAEGGLFVAETYREEAIRSNIVRVRQNTAEKIIDANAGYLVSTNYA